MNERIDDNGEFSQNMTEEELLANGVVLLSR